MFIFTLYQNIMLSKIISNYKSKEGPFLSAVIFLIPVYFILDANNQFWELIPFSGSLKITCVATICATFFYLLLSVWLNRYKVAVLLTLLMLWYLFCKTIKVKLASFQLFSFVDNLGYYFIFSVVLLLLVIVAVFVAKDSLVKKAASYFNVLFTLLVIIEAGKVGVHLLQTKKQKTISENVQLKSVHVQSKPDIYLIVLDEYAGIRSAESNFNFNNQSFVNKLREQGFFVANTPNSNYNSTLFSLSSMLNMNYSASFLKQDLNDISVFGKAAKEIQFNRLTPFLTANGYAVKNYSGFRIQSVPSGAFYFMAIENRLALEKTLGNVLRNEVFTRLPSNSLQRLLGTHLAQVDAYNKSVYTKCLEEFNNLNEQEAPEFVYAHFFMPHEPFMNKEDGTERKYADAFFDKRKGTYKSAYVDYMKYANKQIGGLVDLLLKQRREKIILLVSDHGERFTNGEKKGTAYNNFFAVYDSKKKYGGFSDTFSLINTFRVVLNTHFNQTLPMLENKKLNVYTGKNELF